MMLTKIVGERVYDFSHVVGGRDQVMGPLAVAFGRDNEMYAVVSALGGGRGITKYTVGLYPGEEEMVQRIGESGQGPGQLMWTSGIALDSDYNIYVTDAMTDRISVFSEGGEFLRSFGSSGDGEVQFSRPSGITIDQDDNLLVVDTMNHRVQKLSRDGRYLSEWGSEGSDPGQFRAPWGITTDADGCIYVADHLNHRIQKFDADAVFMFELGSKGSGDYEFDHPSDVAIDPDGDIYVCDWANHRVQAFTADREYVTTFIGDAQELSKWQLEYVRSNPDVYKARRRVYTLEPEWRFALPSAVEFDSRNSRLMVADTQRWRIQIYNKLHDYDDPQFNI
ncbi:MAG: 6-bladed beta-propeller [Dehalococcoidia bacterium]|nr:6-bladed beta-propeller [Dehalococcoidia bacterium]